MRWNKFVKDTFTGVDNTTIDFGRVFGAFCFAGLFGLVIFDCATLHPPTLIEYASACGMILSGVGVLIKVKETTEPPKYHHEEHNE